MQTVYADVLFLMNFTADYLVLFLAAKIRRRSVRKGRILFSACLGGLYSLPALLFIPAGGWLIFSAVLMLAVMEYIAFGYQGGVRFFRGYLLCTLLSALLGGAITLLFRLARICLGTSVVRADTGGKLLVFLVLTLISFIVIAVTNRLAGIGVVKQISVSVTVGCRKKTLILLCDSGCSLQDPLTGKPVIILHPGKAEGLFPPALYGRRAGEAVSLPLAERRRYCVVPYRTLSGKHLMHVYRPDRVELTEGTKTVSIQALIGMGSPEAGGYQGCDGIIPSALVDI